MPQDLAIAIAVVFISDGLAFAWLWDMRHKHKARGSGHTVPITTLVMALLVVGLAHYLALNLVWKVAEVEIGGLDMSMLMIVMTILPGMPPAYLFGQLAIESMTETSVDKVMGFGTARKQETDFSRAKSLASKGDVEAAVAEYRRHYREDPANARPLFQAYRLLYTKNRRDEGADILREIMRAFDDTPETWARAATELANYLQNDKRESVAARKVLHQIIKKAPKTQYGRLAHGRLAGTWDEKPREIEL